MDIIEIIKSNLPEGVEIPEKAIKTIEKEIKQEQGKIFVPKEQYSKKTEKIMELETQITDLQGKSTDGETYKTKLEQLQAEFDTFKTNTDNEKKSSTVYENVLEALKEKGIPEKTLKNPTVLKGLKSDIDLNKVKFDKDNGIKNLDELINPLLEGGLKDFIVTTETKGAEIPTPPTNTGTTAFTIEQIKTMTPAQINENWDKGVRQAIEGGK